MHKAKQHQTNKQKAHVIRLANSQKSRAERASATHIIVAKVHVVGVCLKVGWLVCWALFCLTLLGFALFQENSSSSSSSSSSSNNNSSSSNNNNNNNNSSSSNNNNSNNNNNNNNNNKAKEKKKEGSAMSGVRRRLFSKQKVLVENMFLMIAQKEMKETKSKCLVPT